MTIQFLFLGLITSTGTTFYRHSCLLQSRTCFTIPWSFTFPVLDHYIISNYFSMDCHAIQKQLSRRFLRVFLNLESLQILNVLRSAFDTGALSPVLENFRPAFSPDPSNCPWVSEDALIGAHQHGIAVASMNWKTLVSKTRLKNKQT